MRRVKNFLKYIITFIFIFLILMLVDIIFISIVGICTNSASSHVRVGWLSEQLTRSSQPDGMGNYFIMSEEGLEVIDMMDGFAMLIDENGKVCWEYKMPEELPKEYSNKEIVSFTRWYLKDYPVHTWITDDGIFVFGKPKESEWILNLRFVMDTVKIYLAYGPIIFIGDVILLVVIPVIVVRRQSRRRERERTAWIAGVSHDIRTPLSIVLGTAAVLKEETGDAVIVKKAELIEAQALKIRTLISNLNTENKLQFGLGSWNKEKFTMAAVVREVVCDIANSLQDERYGFDADISEETEGFMVCADRELVRRLFENLVNNAVKHNPDGCNVSVRMKKGCFPYRCIIIVEDDGCGVGPKTLRRMNMPMEWKELPEHGLGLRLVKHIAGLYHWRVRFGKGSTGGLQCLVQIA